MRPVSHPITMTKITQKYHMNFITHNTTTTSTTPSNTNHSPTLTIYNIIQPIIPTSSSNYTPSQNPTSSSTPSSSTNRAYRTFKIKFPNTPFSSNPGTSTTFVNHPLQTITNEFLQIRLPFFPQNTYFYSEPND